MLSGNNFGAEGVKMIKRALKSNSSLTALDIKCNGYWKKKGKRKKKWEWTANKKGVVEKIISEILKSNNPSIELHLEGKDKANY